MSKSTQSIFAFFIAVTIALGLGGCLEGTNKSSSAPRMTKIVFKDSVPLSRNGDSTAAPVTIPAGDSAYCSPTDLYDTSNGKTLRAGARIYYPITGQQPPSQVVETTQPVIVDIAP